MRTRQSRRGANALEFALTLPMFLIVSFGIMEFGYFFPQHALVSSIIGEACREGALVNPKNPPPGIPGCGGTGAVCAEKKAEQVMNARISSSGLNCINCSASFAGAYPNEYIECQMEVQHADITGFMTAMIPTDFRATTRSRLEWQR